MMAVKRTEQRMMSEAITMVAKGKKAPDRVLTILKKFSQEPKHKFSPHDYELMRKFVNGAAPAMEEPKAKFTGVSKADKKLLAMGMEKFDDSPPVDQRLKTYLENYKKSEGRSFRISDTIRTALKRYVATKIKTRVIAPRAKDIGLGLSGHIEMVGPEEALNFLDVNERLGFTNRRINKERVDAYAADMKAGRWRMTGESVVIGKDGQLMNGQHRMYAVIDSETTQPMVIVRGVDMSAFHAMDQGRPRRPADVFGIAGIKNAHLMAATTRHLWIWKTMGPDGFKTGNTMRRESKRGWNNEIAVEIANTPRLAESVNLARAMSSLGPPSAFAFCHFICAAVNREAADEFFDILGNGIGLSKGAPILVLRNRLIADRAQRGLRRPETVNVIRMTMRIWNAWRDKEMLTKMPNLIDSPIPRPK